jgi:hypothetical protein
MRISNLNFARFGTASPRKGNTAAWRETGDIDEKKAQMAAQMATASGD